MAHRLGANSKTPHYRGLTHRIGAGLDWTGEIGVAPVATWQWPLRLKVPRPIFIDSMGDPFYEKVTQSLRDRIMAVALLAPQMTLQLPTKRPETALDYFADEGWRLRVSEVAKTLHGSWNELGDLSMVDALVRGEVKHLRNLWIGTSVAMQKHADHRRPIMQSLAQMGWLTWVSYEPAMGPVDWTGWESFLSWLVGGGASGPLALRSPMHPDWQRASRDFCARHGIPYFFKQWGRLVPASIAKDAGINPANLPGKSFYPWGHVNPQMVDVGYTQVGRLLDGRLHDDRPDYAHEAGAA